MAKILPNFSTQSANEELPRRCSLTATSDKGNRVYGTAALLVITKRSGGVDNFLQNIITTTARATAQEAVDSLQSQYDLTPKQKQQKQLKKVA